MVPYNPLGIINDKSKMFLEMSAIAEPVQIHPIQCVFSKLRANQNLRHC